MGFLEVEFELSTWEEKFIWKVILRNLSEGIGSGRLERKKVYIRCENEVVVFIGFNFSGLLKNCGMYFRIVLVGYKEVGVFIMFIYFWLIVVFKVVYG